MAKIDLIMPKMGESIMEATIISWNKNVGDKVELDETILEIATDKVDSEIPSPVEGVIGEILFKKDDVVAVGTPIATIITEGEDTAPLPSPAIQEAAPAASIATKEEAVEVPLPEKVKAPETQTATMAASESTRFYSPLVKNIAKKEGISLAELNTVTGSGAQGRVNKKDILTYIAQRSSAAQTQAAPIGKPSMPSVDAAPKVMKSESGDEIIEMDRMRKLIADHMVMSKKNSPHVTSFVEADVTKIVTWRNKIKAGFQQKYGEKITYTPIFIEAVTKAIQEFPMINVRVDGSNIIVKKNINVGMAAALPSGNLIVPVIKNADHLSLVGLTKQVNDLAGRARKNALKPDEIQGGTFTLTNVGTFGNLMGTPIINQPQVAIMAAGAIKKKPVVIETSEGDVIGIRSMMFLSLSYDHRVVDGFLGGSFLRKVADNLEAFDADRSI